jgi:hypothetical protein
MAGCKQGVAKRFLEISQKALFVHCHVHRLNLALSSCAQRIKEVRDTVHVVEELSVFVGAPKDMHCFNFGRQQTSSIKKPKQLSSSLLMLVGAHIQGHSVR